MTALISTEDLAHKIGQPQLRMLDASWFMPAEKRNPQAEYKAAHIPGAVFFDIDAISDHSSPYPHMLPAASFFAAKAGALGIGNDSEIVVYDGSGLFSAARVWWMFRAFGHDNIRVLDGGLPKWKAENRPLESGDVSPAPATFIAHYLPDLVRPRAQVRANIFEKKEVLVDARSQARFAGTEPEPRAGVRSGHIEGSANIFFRDCLSAPYNELKKPEALRALFAAQGISASQPLAATCGSGVTACILALALFELGNKEVAIYDGAWAEWGSLNPPR